MELEQPDSVHSVDPAEDEQMQAQLAQLRLGFLDTLPAEPRPPDASPMAWSLAAVANDAPEGPLQPAAPGTKLCIWSASGLLALWHCSGGKCFTSGL